MKQAYEFKATGYVKVYGIIALAVIPWVVGVVTIVRSVVT